MIGLGQNNMVHDLGRVVIRIPRHPEAERDLKREAHVLEALRPLLPTPALELRSVGERLVSVHPKLHGSLLSDLTELSEEERQNLGSVAKAGECQT